ncbi:MAG: hypothetical protein Q8R85_17135 [Bosea sp. (in: a-proteobacteria)]|uniref:hypothetical protein n=1 Tax=Bosea sp. (in: a-proteobacteria) TaxID=1871050 RepID=UPI002734937C|nr:hypothetical protein [Bosea sp. (in: a-proteobacteria)]MDP3602885.1 hypothetical protein [Bosea sp. (in: a-proteobacteria)]
MEDDLFVAQKIDNYRMLCVSSLARKTISDCEASHLGTEAGYFVYEVDDRPESGGLHVLAKVASIEAAYRLIEIILDRGRAVSLA